MHDCSTHVHDARRVDPSGTRAIRVKFEREMVRRFRILKQRIQQAIVDLDVLGLQPDSASKAFNALVFSKTFRPGPALHDEAPHIGRETFGFHRAGEKVSAFMEWLREVQQTELFEVSSGTPNSSAASGSWQNTYLRSAYQRGLEQSYSELNGAGASVSQSWISGGFFRPIHADAVGLIFTRAYSDLVGISEAMDAKISRTLAQGMAEGRGVRELARTMNEAVDGIGIVRARTLVRTELVRANADATLNGYTEAGVEGVLVRAEWLTARDDAVCPLCEPKEGQIYTIEEAQGMLPLHPNCRCAWSPVVPENATAMVLQ